MKILSTTALLLSAASGVAPAAISLASATSSPNLVVPDYSSVGVSNTLQITSDIQAIQSVEVTLTLSGGFNGDYYVYLRHGSSLAVLMNRAGVTASHELGYPDSGISVVTFSTNAPNGDIHKYRAVSNPGGAALNGTWQPDGRTADPDSVLDTSPRTAGLDVFNNQPASGDWTLFVADRSSGYYGTLTNWSLNLTGNTVPEPAAGAVLGLAAAALALRRRR